MSLLCSFALALSNNEFISFCSETFTIGTSLDGYKRLFVKAFLSQRGGELWWDERHNLHWNFSCPVVFFGFVTLYRVAG
jgi:hypothetical protein